MEKHKFLLIVVAFIVAFSSLSSASASSASSASANDGVVVALSADQAEFSADQAVVVRVTVSNPTNHTVKVLKWLTPAEDVEEPLFAVAVEGVPVAYVGPTYKRPDAKSSDYVSLKAGESFTRDVDLSAYYDFSVSGAYSVKYDVTGLELYLKDNDKSKKAGRLESNTLELKVEGSARKPTPPPPPPGSGTSFNRCTADQQGLLLTARTEASNYAAGALSYLNAGTQGPRYTTWFGTYDASRYSTVRGNFGKISSAMDTASVTFDCGCKKQYYAYVYPNQPYTIYLCATFWKAPMTGTDSKAGTLIHEMSHFNVVAGTDDYVYGQAGAKNLAITNPNQAIGNADNHEYFAENTPELR